MKLKLMTSTQQPTSEDCYSGYIYPGADATNCIAIKPNPPTPEAIKRAQFVDKTYRWTGK